MVSSSMPAAPRLALTCWYASHTARLAITKGFVDVMSLIPAKQVGDNRQPGNAAPSLPSRYRSFIATMSSPDPRSGIGILPRGFCHLSFPFASRTRLSRSIPKPVLSSCRLYTGCHRVRKQVSSRFILGHRNDPVSTALNELTMLHRTVCFRSSPQHTPDALGDAFSSVVHHHAF
jgi:hypothetical protein